MNNIGGAGFLQLLYGLGSLFLYVPFRFLPTQAQDAKAQMAAACLRNVQLSLKLMAVRMSIPPIPRR